METLRAADVMRRNVITLAPDDSLGAACEMLRLGRIRQLPVVRESRVLGELSFRDACATIRAELSSVVNREGELLAAELERVLQLPVERVMRPAGAWVYPESPLAQVALRIAARGTGFVLVVETGARVPRLLGVITERDLLCAAVDPGGLGLERGNASFPTAGV